jgi:hypothetical protein
MAAAMRYYRALCEYRPPLSAQNNSLCNSARGTATSVYAAGNCTVMLAPHGAWKEMALQAPSPQVRLQPVRTRSCTWHGPQYTCSRAVRHHLTCMPGRRLPPHLARVGPRTQPRRAAAGRHARVGPRQRPAGALHRRHLPPRRARARLALGRRPRRPRAPRRAPGRRRARTAAARHGLRRPRHARHGPCGLRAGQPRARARDQPSHIGRRRAQPAAAAGVCGSRAGGHVGAGGGLGAHASTRRAAGALCLRARGPQLAEPLGGRGVRAAPADGVPGHHHRRRAPREPGERAGGSPAWRAGVQRRRARRVGRYSGPARGTEPRS